MAASQEEIPSPGLGVVVTRYATFIKWVSVGLIVSSLFVILRKLPLGSAMQALESWIRSLGIWGPVVFGVIYVVAVVLLVPGAALTLAAGAIFGLVTGTIVVSLASTTGVAATFLISRYLARDWVARKIKQYPKFDAIDKAVSKGGWKVVALLRLSPAVPFTLQNYLYGLTGIGFWTCVLTSWIAMLPGTFLYVYLGYIGGASIEATGGKHGKTPGEWALTVVGLLATVVVTVYITRLARKALKQQADIEPAPEAGSRQPDAPAEAKGWPWGTTITVGIAVLAVTAAVLVEFDSDRIQRWFGRMVGPAPVMQKETTP